MTPTPTKREFHPAVALPTPEQENARLRDECAALRSELAVSREWSKHVASGLRSMAETCYRLANLLERKS